jgi:colanic acid/amylovoran biosynthesis glycosyltransferase
VTPGSLASKESAHSARPETPPPALRVAYLINQYPKVTHSFIRREIAALEALGVTVERFTIRRAEEALANPADQQEAKRTTALLESKLAMLASMPIFAVTHPVRYTSAKLAMLRLALRSRRGLLRHVAYLAEACLLARRLRKLGVTHIHAHFGTNAAAVVMLISILNPDITYSFTVHGPEEFEDAAGLSLAEKIRRSAFVVGISSFGRSQLMLHTPPENVEKIKIVRCGIDDAYFQAGVTEVPANSRLVCVGRLCVRKGQLQLVEAVHRLRGESVDVELVLAGDGEVRGELERRVADYGMQSAVRITGWIGDEEIRRELIAARAFVLPSFAEGLPVVIMEALALGRPVVSTYVAGIPELVTDSVCGWLVPAGDVEALMTALRRVLAASPVDLSRMGSLGAARVRERHDTHKEAAKLAGLFRSILNEPRP